VLTLAIKMLYLSNNILWVINKFIKKSILETNYKNLLTNVIANIKNLNFVKVKLLGKI
jgi:hypothetical protein